jgi:superfamily II DNA or RNA helicase
LWKDYIKKDTNSDMSPAISSLKFPFVLKPDQLAAVDSWIKNGYRGSIIYSTGTGKTEIAYESARRACLEVMRNTQFNKNLTSSFNILFLVPRIVLIEQNVNRLLRYNISKCNK